jgi:hypothetical protein
VFTHLTKEEWSMERRFRALRFVATLFKALAWVALILGVFGTFVLIIAGVLGGNLFQDVMGTQMGMGTRGGIGSILGSLFGGLVVLAISGLYFVFLYAYAEAIHLLLSIEENTRQTAHALAQIASEREET